MSKSSLARVLLAFLCCIGSPAPFSQTSPFSVDPYIGAKFGDPYDSVKLVPAPSNGHCIVIDDHEYIEDTSRLVGSQTRADSIKKHSDLIKQMSFSARTAFNAIAIGGSTRASGKYGVLNETRVTRDSETYLRSDYRTNPIKLLDLEHVRLSDKWIEKLSATEESRRIKNIDEFRSVCGDTFIVGRETGDVFFGTFWKFNESVSSKKKKLVSLQASYKSPSVNASASADYKSLNTSLKALEKTEARAYSSIKINRKVETLSDLKNAWQEFDSSESDGNRVINLYAISYERVKGYPKKGVLNSSINEEYLLILVGTLWDLRSMREEAQYIRKNKQLYARGIRKKANRDTFVKRLLKRWTKEYEWLKNKTEMCLEEFTPDCADLARRYEADPILSERDLLPKKKNTVCEDIDIEISYNNNEEYEYPTNVGGDKWELEGNGKHKHRYDMDGCPVLLIAGLKIEPQGNILKAKLVTRKTQITKNCKRSRGWTQFKHVKSWQLFSLSEHLNNKGDNPVADCAFYEDGVELPKSKFCMTGNGRKAHGLVLKTTPPSPSHKNPYKATAKNNCGLLEYVNCRVDKKGSDHDLPCFTPSIKPIKIDLVNKSDIRADKWKASSLKKTIGAKVR